ncbi:MAG: hypothetical protein AB8B93_07755 [Pseudomonadales bacterium]
MRQYTAATNPTPHRRRARQLPTLLAIMFLGALVSTTLHAEQPRIIGTWVINAERSAAAQPEHLESRDWLAGGRLSTSVNVGGIPIPTGGGNKSREVSSQPAKDPDILRCKRMHIEAAGEDLRMTYEEVGSDLFRKGKYRGVTTRWNKKRLNSHYRTTTRKVTHELALQADDSLLVTVTIKAKGSRKRTYKQVFEREPGNS